MIERIAQTILKGRRQITLKNINTKQCYLMRKVVTRISDKIIMGLPDLGGTGMLTSEDEQDYRYDLIGQGYALTLDVFQPSQMFERQDANIGFGDEFRFVIEPNEDIDTVNFNLQKGDLIVTVSLNIEKDNSTAQILQFYEIIRIETRVNISPFSLEYICNRRNNLDNTIEIFNHPTLIDNHPMPDTFKII